MTVNDSSSPCLGTVTARDVCQILREVTFGRRTMVKVGKRTWDDVYSSHLHVGVDGWRITLCSDCVALDYCSEALSPDGNRWTFDPGARYGTDPVALLSTWEHQTLERMLKAL